MNPRGRLNPATLAVWCFRPLSQLSVYLILLPSRVTHSGVSRLQRLFRLYDDKSSTTSCEAACSRFSPCHVSSVVLSTAQPTLRHFVLSSWLSAVDKSSTVFSGKTISKIILPTQPTLRIYFSCTSYGRPCKIEFHLPKDVVHFADNLIMAFASKNIGHSLAKLQAFTPHSATSLRTVYFVG